MFQDQNRETEKVVVFFKIIMTKTVFHNTTPDLQDQDQDRIFGLLAGLVLRPTVSDHITAFNTQN